MITKRLLSAKDVAEMLGIKPSTVYAYANNGTLTPIFLPSVADSKATIRNKRFLRFSVAEVENFLHNLSGWSSANKNIGGDQ